jgi:hypothetical protein
MKYPRYRIVEFAEGLFHVQCYGVVGTKSGSSSGKASPFIYDWYSIHTRRTGTTQESCRAWIQSEVAPKRESDVLVIILGKV